MPSKASHRRYVVVLNAPRSPSRFIVWGNSVLTRMTGNSWFPRPKPALSKVKAALVAADKAQTATLMGGMDTRSARDIAIAAALRQFQLLASYVQTVADANPEESLALIQSSGFAAKRSSGSRARTFEAGRDRVSGSAWITAPTAGDAVWYFWQMSTDGRKTWIDLPRTRGSKTVVSGLTPGTTVFFRYKTLTKNGESDWSNPISYLVD